MGSVPLSLEQFLPEDGFAGTLVGRAWITTPTSRPSRRSGSHRHPGRRSLRHLRGRAHHVRSARAPNPAASVKAARGKKIASVEELVGNSGRERFNPRKPFLLAPCDLQVIKAAGVTFASSLIERVIEEQARGNPARAEAVRKQVVALIGENLRTVKPGSPQAMQIKQVLIEQGLWSQYLEVGIGPDAEVFTKAPVLSSVGSGADIGIHPDSAWNNPEPEIVLAVNSRGETVGATLGNDVNLRDFEGRSALLLPKAKDNNASCAIGPYIRLFDATFSIDDVRQLDGEPAGGRRRRLHASRRQFDEPDQPRSARPGGRGHGPLSSVSRRHGAVPGNHVRAHGGSRATGQRLHPQGGRHRQHLQREAGNAGEPRRP